MNMIKELYDIFYVEEAHKKIKEGREEIKKQIKKIEADIRKIERQYNNTDNPDVIKRLDNLINYWTKEKKRKEKIIGV